MRHGVLEELRGCMLFVVSEAEDLSSGYKHRMQLDILGGGTLISAMYLAISSDPQNPHCEALAREPENF